MIVLGIDPGTARCGWGIIKKAGSKIEMVDFGCFVTAPELPSGERLESIYILLCQLIKKIKPDQAGVEQLFFTNNAKTVMSIAEARGVIILALRQNKIPFMEYTPYQIKQAVSGYGAADKKQIQKMVKMLLKLDQIPKPDDAADGLAIAITASNKHLNLP